MNKYISQTIIVGTALFLPFSAFAGLTNPCPTNPPQAWFNCLTNNVIWGIAWPLFAALIVIMTIVAGILFVTARGKEDQVNLAKKMLIYIAIGVILGLFAFSMEGLVRELLGIAAPTQAP